MSSPKAHIHRALACAASLAALLALPAGAVAANATTAAAGGTAAPATSTPAYTVPPASTVPPTTTPPTATPPTATTTLTPSAAGTPGTAPATRVPGTARASAAKTGGGGVSGWAILAAVLGALVALAAIVWAVFRFGAYEPHWLQSARHSFGEAGYRASATWAEFADWARIGH